jgi:hypothetical protein
MPRNAIVDREQVALLARQSQIRAVVRRVIWRDFPAQASPELVERVCQAVFDQLHVCCTECAEERPAANGRGCGCR